MQYRQTSNVNRTLVGIFYHSDVFGSSHVGVAPTCIFILGLTLGFNGLGKDNGNTRRKTFKFWDLVRLILEIWWKEFVSDIDMMKLLHWLSFGVSSVYYNDYFHASLNFSRYIAVLIIWRNHMYQMVLNSWSWAIIRASLILPRWYNVMVSR